MNGRTKSKACLIISIFLLGMACSAAAGRTIYVDADASGANDGSSWSDAYNYLQDTLTDANSALKPIEIRVAEGIYTPDSNSANPNGSGDRTATFQLINGVTLKGGYAGFGEPEPNAWDVELYETILSGDLDGNDIDVNDIDVNDLWYLWNEPSRAENSYHVVTGSGTDETSVLDGFTIAAGNANYYSGYPPHAYSCGGGIYTDSGGATMINCTFRDNSASRSGGGMYNSSGVLKLINCTFQANVATDGGGMQNQTSDLTFINCTFRDNTATFAAGGMGIWDSNATLADCTFSGNIGGYAIGGLHNINSNVKLTNCIFIGNWTPLPGTWGGGSTGGLGISGGKAVVTHCIFKGNSARHGAGIMGDTNLTLTNCIFSGNSAVYSGGGMLNSSRTVPTKITNCTFSGNSAGEGGGIYNSYRDSATITNCNFSGNFARRGGAINNESFSSATLTNCILWNNTAASGPQVEMEKESSLEMYYCCIEDGQAGIYDPYHGLVWGTGNIDADPCFVLPGYWAYVNDPNIIVEPNHPNAVWIDGDYHLKSEGWRWDSVRGRWHYDEVTSRCIDAGNPGSLLGEELLFIPDDPNNVWGRNLRINMGAYGGTSRASIPPYNWSLLVDLTNDGKVNYIDLAHLKENWLNSSVDLPSDFDRNCFVDMADFSLLAQDWLRCTSFWITEPPFVRITKPEDGSWFTFGQSVEIEAEAWDNDGSVVSIEFFVNTVKNGEDLDGSDGWKIVSDTLLFTSFITARATDNKGSKAISVPVTVYPILPQP